MNFLVLIRYYIVPFISILLAIAGTHGSGIGFNNIAAMVTKLELINGEGIILTLSAQHNEDIFKAAQV